MTTIYKVNDLYPCIQGEGALAGTPMVMLRLQECPVGCPFCDTKETWAADPADQSIELPDAMGVNPRWAAATAERIEKEVVRVARGIRWVLVSGGEPLMQDCTDLTVLLAQRHGFKMALETSGTAPLSGHWDHITVSPKVGMPGGLGVLHSVVERADEIKWVVGKQDDLEKLDDFLAAHNRKFDCSVALQPMSLNEKATALCEERCLQKGWRLSVQLHKFLHPNWKTASV